MSARSMLIKGMCLTAGFLSPVAFATDLSTIITGRGHWGGQNALQVIGLGTDGYAYVPFWQDSGGNWTAGAVLPGQSATVSSLTASQGNGGNLQVLGIRSSDSQPQLVGSQDANGTWYAGSGLPSNGTPLRQLVAATGACASAPLQIIGLGTDYYPRVVAYQDSGGAWHASGQVLESSTPISSLSVGYGNQGNLQVYGLVFNNTYPNNAMFLGFQDHTTCTWTGGSAVETVYVHYRALVQANGNHGNLQVLGLPFGVSPPFQQNGQAPYLVTWQDSNGNWSGIPGQIVNNFSPVLNSFAAAQGNGGNLQVWGLGADYLPHMVAWQNQSGTWSGVGSVPSNNSSPLKTLVMDNGNGGNVQVIGLGTNQHIIQISYQDNGSGTWYAGADLTKQSTGGGGGGGGGCPRC